MRIQYEPTLIFSVYKSTDTDILNADSHVNMISYLAFQDIRFKEVLGSYQGVLERSFVVSAKHETEIVEICKANKQVCYLHLDQDRNAEFVNPYNESRKSAGVFKAVEHLAVNEDYTLDVSTGIKYAIR